MRKWIRRTSSLFAGALLGCPLSAAAQEPPPKIPSVESVAPKITPAPVQEPLIPPPSLGDPVPPTPSGAEASRFTGFTYSGSPFGNLNGSVNTLSGVPTPLFDLPLSGTLLDQGRISERAASTTPQILQNLPGVFIQRTNQGGGSLIIRGRNGNQNLIMVDGIPINDAGWRFANIQYLNTIDPGVIDHIEVLRGPHSVLFGSGAMGGVLNIVTKGRKDYSQSVDVGGGFVTRYGSASNDAYNRVEVQGNFRNMGFFAGGSYFDSGALNAGQGVFFPDQTVGYDQRAADLKVDWRLNDCWTATFAFQHMYQPSVPRTDRFPLPEVDPTRFVNQPTFTDQQRNFGYLRFNRFSDSDAFNNVQLTFALQQRREFEDAVSRTLGGAFIDQNLALEDFWYGGVDLRATTALGYNHAITYGVTYWHHQSDATRERRRSATGKFSPRTPTIAPDGEYGEFGVFLLDTARITDWLVLQGGVRYSNINARGTAGFLDPNQKYFSRNFDDVSGEFGFTLAATDQIHWYGSVREGFRAPNLEDLSTSDRSTGRGPDFGATNLNPERVLSYETGVKVLGERFQGSAAYFYDTLESQIVRVRDGSANTRRNTRGLMHGVELEGIYFITPNWTLFGTATQLYGQDTTLDEPLSRIPPAWMNFGTRIAGRGERWGWFAELYAELMDRQDRYSAQDGRDIRFPIGGVPAWQTFNLRAGVDGDRFGKFTVGVYNIFDQNYRYLGSGVDAPGIEARVGYELSF